MRVRSILLSAALLATVVHAPSNASEGLVSRLDGTWDGWGTIRLADGTSDQLRCRAVYSGEADTLTETLSCQGKSYRIEGSGTFAIEGGSVSGTWTEESFGVGGEVSGTASEEGLDLRMKGPTFSVAYNLDVEGCRQSLRISPEGTHVESVTAMLRRC